MLGGYAKGSIQRLSERTLNTNANQTQPSPAQIIASKLINQYLPIREPSEAKAKLNILSFSHDILYCYVVSENNLRGNFMNVGTSEALENTNNWLDLGEQAASYNFLGEYTPAFNEENPIINIENYYLVCHTSTVNPSKNVEKLPLTQQIFTSLFNSSSIQEKYYYSRGLIEPRDRTSAPCRCIGKTFTSYTNFCRFAYANFFASDSISPTWTFTKKKETAPEELPEELQELLKEFASLTFTVGNLVFVPYIISFDPNGDLAFRNFPSAMENHLCVGSRCFTVNNQGPLFLEWLENWENLLGTNSMRPISFSEWRNWMHISKEAQLMYRKANIIYKEILTENSVQGKISLMNDYLETIISAIRIRGEDIFEKLSLNK